MMSNNDMAVVDALNTFHCSG